MNIATKSAEEFTSIADWERRYMPNGIPLDSNDFGSEVVDGNIVDSIAKELCRPVAKKIEQHGNTSKAPTSKKPSR